MTKDRVTRHRIMLAMGLTAASITAVVGATPVSVSAASDTKCALAFLDPAAQNGAVCIQHYAFSSYIFIKGVNGVITFPPNCSTTFSDLNSYVETRNSSVIATPSFLAALVQPGSGYSLPNNCKISNVQQAAFNSTVVGSKFYVRVN